MTELSSAVGAAGTGGCAAICTVGNGAGVLAIWRPLAGLRGGRTVLTVACFGAAVMRGATLLTAGASSGSRGVILKTASALIAVSTGAATGVISGVFARL